MQGGEASSWIGVNERGQGNDAMSVHCLSSATDRLPKLETGDRRWEAGNRKPETRNRKLETGNRKPEGTHSGVIDCRAELVLSLAQVEGNRLVAASASEWTADVAP